MSGSGRAVLVAMSGGVDSTVAAYLARRAGHTVTGVHLRLDDSPADPVLAAACAELGIELVEWDCRAAFQERVIVPAAREYAAGRTPNPCCQCNKVLKFAELLRCAADRNAAQVWTGHYVRRCSVGNGAAVLRRAVDAAKDQSYFLYRLGQAELARLEFPLGTMTKSEVRQLAAAAGLPCASRPDSQDACFQQPGEACSETLRRRTGIAGPPGRFLWRGREVGRHSGIHRYTLGQRQGLGVALGVPGYVRSIDPVGGDIALTTDATELLSPEFIVAAPEWTLGRMPSGTAAGLTVRVRYRSPGAACVFYAQADGSLRVVPASPLRAVTPGQAAVFYQDDVLLGGGTILRTGAAEA